MTDDKTPGRPQARLLTILDVMREPIVSYAVCAPSPLDGKAAEERWSFDNEAEAFDAARDLESSGGKDVTVELRVLRVVEEVTVLDWRREPA